MVHWSFSKPMLSSCWAARSRSKSREALGSRTGRPLKRRSRRRPHKGKRSRKPKRNGLMRRGRAAAWTLCHSVTVAGLRRYSHSCTARRPANALWRRPVPHRVRLLAISCRGRCIQVRMRLPGLPQVEGARQPAEFSACPRRPSKCRSWGRRTPPCLPRAEKIPL